MQLNHKQAAMNAEFNNCHHLTIVKDYRDTGGCYWKLLAGLERREGFMVKAAATRRELLDDAVEMAAHMKLAVVGYEHGSDYRFIDVRCRTRH